MIRSFCQGMFTDQTHIMARQALEIVRSSLKTAVAEPSRELVVERVAVVVEHLKLLELKLDMLRLEADQMRVAIVSVRSGVAPEAQLGNSDEENDGGESGGELSPDEHGVTLPIRKRRL